MDYLKNIQKIAKKLLELEEKITEINKYAHPLMREYDLETLTIYLNWVERLNNALREETNNYLSMTEKPKPTEEVVTAPKVKEVNSKPSGCEICRVYGRPSTRLPSTSKEIRMAYGKSCDCDF